MIEKLLAYQTADAKLREIEKKLGGSEEKKKAMSILMKTQTGKDFTFDDKLVGVLQQIAHDGGGVSTNLRIARIGEVGRVI